MHTVFCKSISLFTTCLALLSGCFVFSACDNCDSNNKIKNKVTNEDIYNKSLSDFDEIKSNSIYDNLSFDDADIRLSSDITDFSVIDMSYFNYTQKESLTLFENILKDTFTNNINDEDCFFNSPDIKADFGNLTVEYPELYSLSYYDKIIKEILPVDMYLYQTDTFELHECDQYFMMFSNCGLLKMNRGTFTRAIEKNRNLAGWMPRDNYPLYEEVSVNENNRVIKFKNESQKLVDAINYCNSYFNNLKLTDEKSLSFIVSEANVIENNYSNQALFLFLTRSYNGIPFDTLNSEGVFSAFSDGNDYCFDSSEALMCNADEIEYYFLTVNNSNIVKESEIEEIISLRNAVDILSSYMTSNIRFNVESVSLVYSNMLVNNAEFQSSARPTWKFILNNSNDNLTYSVFVDIESGNCHYYTF